jgi:hypothetical protein
VDTQLSSRCCKITLSSLFCKEGTTNETSVLRANVLRDRISPHLLTILENTFVTHLHSKEDQQFSNLLHITQRRSKWQLARFYKTRALYSYCKLFPVHIQVIMLYSYCKISKNPYFKSLGKVFCYTATHFFFLEHIILIV